MDSYLIADIFSNPLLALSFSGLLETLYNIAKVALGIGFVIFIHELGHFLAAKACGVKCEKFYVGFDPPMKYLPSALMKFQWGETEYGIGIIPLGGYVKMLGQDDNPGNAADEAERSKIVTTTPDGEEHVTYDPRSYVAKSVPQRMLIISAGVIMNLISAVFIAAIAYRAGVTIMPVEIGGSSPGDPAWVTGMLPGDKVVKILPAENNDPEDEKVDEYLRWRWEFTPKIFKSGLRESEPIKPLFMKVRDREGDVREITLRPTDRQKHITQNVAVGVHPLGSNRISSRRPLRDYLSVGKADPPLKAGDRIVAIDGEQLPIDHMNELGDVPATLIHKALVTRTGEPLRLTVEREPEEGELETFDTVLAPNPMKSLGLIMKPGPIVGLREGSPAAEAGFQLGDELVSIQGEPIGDPLTLPYRVPQGEMLDIVVRRDGKEQTIQVKQDLDMWNAHFDGLGARMALETIGLAYSVTRIVDEIVPDSPADKSSKIRVGDEVLVLQLTAEGDAHQEAIKRHHADYNKPQELDDEVFTWVFVNGTIQAAGPGVDFRLTVLRDGDKEEVQLSSYDVEGQFTPDRGLVFASMQRVHTAKDWSEAFQLGLRETGEKANEVWSVLTMLFTGQLPLGSLGGPVLIATVAGAEASEGIPRLLLFLTFLSVNLAILNFLPIPVLDGGHMVFLMAEGVLGRPVPERIQQSLTFVGFCGLMALMVFVFTNDIARLFGS